MADHGRSYWRERSKVWAAAAPRGRPEDDAFNQMIITEAAIRPGEAVLDTASGTGDPAISIALFMAGKGTVTCSDLTPRMLDAARDRARNLELANMAFVAADMVALPFADASFDCVTCSFGIVNPDDKVAAAAEAKRVLKPGGRAVYLVSGAYEDNPAFSVPTRAVEAFFGEGVDPTPKRHAMSPPGTLKGVLMAAGFEAVEERGVSHTKRVEDARAYVSDRLKRSFAAKIEGLSETEFEALSKAVLAAWEPFMEDGVLCVPYTAQFAIASAASVH
jgi:ubiquinone/menaquinone biosynthesis C-methylase UbiE